MECSAVYTLRCLSRAEIINVSYRMDSAIAPDRFSGTRRFVICFGSEGWSVARHSSRPWAGRSTNILCECPLTSGSRPRAGSCDGQLAHSSCIGSRPTGTPGASRYPVDTRVLHMGRARPGTQLSAVIRDGGLNGP